MQFQAKLTKISGASGCLKFFLRCTIQAEPLGEVFNQAITLGLNKPTLNDGVADYSARREVIRRHGGLAVRRVW